jgi:hypothetical protein
MNKLMIAAAAATLAVASYGSITVTNCAPVSAGCPQVIFKVTGSGKTATASVKEYKTVSKLKISKGALVLWGNGADDEACCYDQYSLYLNVKVGKVTYKILKPQSALDSWTIFGKNMDKADSYDGTKNKKYSLESQLGISHMAGDGLYDEDLADFDDNLAFYATAFGKATYKYTAGKVPKNQCQTCTVATYDVIPGNYSGWFAGVMTADGDELCLTCGCNELDVFGGTWKAKYDKSMSVVGGWSKAASYAFGSSLAAAMKAEEVE